jgi:hypothetical protein
MSANTTETSNKKTNDALQEMIHSEKQEELTPKLVGGKKWERLEINEQHKGSRKQRVGCLKNINN